MRDQEWDSTSSKLHSLDLSKLVLGLSSLDSVDGESTLGIVDETEVLAGLVDRDHIHEPGWVGSIGSYFAIDLDESLHDNLGDFTAIEGVLQSVSEEDNERKAVSLLVRTWTARIPSVFDQRIRRVATHDGFGA